MPEHRDREHLRTTFDRVSEQYEAARPTSPAALFEDLVELARIPPGGRILEIGPGTGKATVALAERGFNVLGVELGSRLAAVARRRLAAFPNGQVVVTDFEQFEPELADFDAVVAFTSFHWIAPELRYAKTAQLLRSGGALAVAAAEHVLAGGRDDAFWLELQEDYDAVAPHPDNGPPGPPADAEDWSKEIEASGLFAEVLSRQHLWTVEYTADEYIAVIGTYSDNLALPDEQREELFTRIHARIAARGTVEKTYLGMLNVARKS
jgi:SAM-dependent methyltransferase